MRGPSCLARVNLSLYSDVGDCDLVRQTSTGWRDLCSSCQSPELPPRLGWMQVAWPSLSPSPAPSTAATWHSSQLTAAAPPPSHLPLGRDLRQVDSQPHSLLLQLLQLGQDGGEVPHPRVARDVHPHQQLGELGTLEGGDIIGRDYTLLSSLTACLMPKFT